MGLFDIFRPESEAEFRARVGYGAANEPFFRTQAEANAWRAANPTHVMAGTRSGGVLGSVTYAAAREAGVSLAEARALTQFVIGEPVAPARLPAVVPARLPERVTTLPVRPVAPVRFPSRFAAPRSSPGIGSWFWFFGF